MQVDEEERNGTGGRGQITICTASKYSTNSCSNSNSNNWTKRRRLNWYKSLNLGAHLYSGVEPRDVQKEKTEIRSLNERETRWVEEEMGMKWRETMNRMRVAELHYHEFSPFSLHEFLISFFLILIPFHPNWERKKNEWEIDTDHIKRRREHRVKDQNKNGTKKLSREKEICTPYHLFSRIDTPFVSTSSTRLNEFLDSCLPIYAASEYRHVVTSLTEIFWRKRVPVTRFTRQSSN